MALEKISDGIAYQSLLLYLITWFREAVTIDIGEIAMIEDGIVFHRAMHNGTKVN